MSLQTFFVVFITFQFNFTLDSWTIEMDFIIIRQIYGFRICNMHIYSWAYKSLQYLIDNCHHPTNLTPLVLLLHQKPRWKSRKLNVQSFSPKCLDPLFHGCVREKNYMPLKVLFTYNLLSVYLLFCFSATIKTKNFHLSKRFIKDTPSSP